jgi:hypothetical protein
LIFKIALISLHIDPEDPWTQQTSLNSWRPWLHTSPVSSWGMPMYQFILHLSSVQFIIYKLTSSSCASFYGIMIMKQFKQWIGRMINSFEFINLPEWGLNPGPLCRMQVC